MFFVCPCRSPMGEEQPRSEHQNRMVGGPVWTRSNGSVSAKEVRDHRRNGHPAFALRVEGMVCTDAKRRFHVEAELGPNGSHRYFGAQYAVFHILDKRLLRSSSTGMGKEMNSYQYYGLSFLLICDNIIIVKYLTCVYYVVFTGVHQLRLSKGARRVH